MLRKFFSTIPGNIRWLFTVYFLGIVVFTFFRLLLFLTNLPKLTALPADQKFSLISSAFLMGLRFDTVISGYILAVPFLVSLVYYLLNKKNVLRVSGFATVYAGILYSISILICSADIPYFNYYFSRLTTSVLNWFDEGGFMIGMVTKEPAYLIYVLLSIVILLVFWKFLLRINSAINKDLMQAQNFSLIKLSVYNILAIILIFIAIRGRVELKSPIRAGTAYFSSFAFPNQLGLNPVFTFLRSALDDLDGRNKQLQLMDEITAEKLVRGYLETDTVTDIQSPVYRFVKGDANPKKLNVVVILMESMTADKLGYFGNKNKLTPFLDSLISVSYSFDNFYSAGIHTYNGVFSTLYSFPSLLKQHPMKVTRLPQMSGFPVTLKSLGYSTVFFTTHDEQFDNMSGFMFANGFEGIISQKDFPKEYVLGPTGVPDHILFDQSIPHLSKLAGMNKPFFAAMLTASDHGPYNLPSGIPFQPVGSGIHEKIVQYADWSLRQFFLNASKEPWFSNTLFVLVADHGANMNPVYEFPLSFVHTPFVIYSKAFSNAPQQYKQMGGQIDVFPTVMGILGLPYGNYTFGVDLLKTRRPYIYFSNDEKIGCIGSEFYFLRKEDGTEQLFRYTSHSTTDELKNNPQLADAMRSYIFSMMQTAQKLLHSGNTIK